MDRGNGHDHGGATPTYTVVPLGGPAWQRHLPSLEAAQRAAANALSEGINNLVIIDESRREIVLHAVYERVSDYSVRLAGMLAWEDHLTTLAEARRSAEEPRGMGLQDIHIIDNKTGEFVE